MPLDVRGRTCATMTVPASMETWPERVGQTFHHRRDWDRGLQLFPVNEEFLVSASHKLALITSLPFVHTARRYYRLNGQAEVIGLVLVERLCCLTSIEKMTKLDHLEEVKVVTRFP